MTIISKLKSLLGLDAGGRDRGGTTVTVEREPRAESERAVKESPGPSSAAEPATEPETESEPTGLAETVEEAEPEPAASEAAEGSDEPVESLSGIGPAYAERLNEAGIETVGDLAAADAADLAAATDLGESRVAGWIEQAKGA